MGPVAGMLSQARPALTPLARPPGPAGNPQVPGMLCRALARVAFGHTLFLLTSHFGD